MCVEDGGGGEVNLGLGQGDGGRRGCVEDKVSISIALRDCC